MPSINHRNEHSNTSRKVNAMNNYYINAMNVTNGYTKMHIVKGENKDHAIQRLESDEYITPESPDGWEVQHYEFDEYCDY